MIGINDHELYKAQYISTPGFDPAAAVRELRDGAVRPPRAGRVGDDDAGGHPGLPVEVAGVAQAG